MINLTELYLNAVEATATSAGLDTALQPLDEKQGRVWFMRPNATKPVAVLTFQFEVDAVVFSAQLASTGQKHPAKHAYADGIDDFVEGLHKLLTSNRLADKRRVA